MCDRIKVILKISIQTLRTSSNIIPLEIQCISIKLSDQYNYLDYFCRELRKCPPQINDKFYFNFITGVLTYSKKSSWSSKLKKSIQISDTQ